MFVCPECGAVQPAQGRCGADGTQLAPIGDDVLLGTAIGPYRVARLLGVGGMGRVYKGVHPSIGSRVAIKVLSRECSDRRDLVERFFAEARAVNLIRHESIVNILDLATLPDGRPYIIMEYLDGAPLSGVVEVAQLRGQPLPLGGLARLAAEVLDALGAAHGKGIVHRDLKPDNVFVTPAGRAKVLDFGIAKLSDTPVAAATRTGSLLGTPHYMSPEQAAGRPVDHRTDIYAMGVILFECATGRKPFHADSLFELLRLHIEAPPPSPRAFRPDIPAGLEQVIATALAKAPDARFASAQAMSTALHHAAQELPPAAWAPITGGGDAVSTTPQVWAPSMPASWAGSHQPASLPPPATPTTMSGSAGQVAQPTAAPSPSVARAPSSSKGAWIALGALVLVGGGVVAGVLATGGGGAKPAAAPVVAHEPPPTVTPPTTTSPPSEPSPVPAHEAKVAHPAGDRVAPRPDKRAGAPAQVAEADDPSPAPVAPPQIASAGAWPSRHSLSFAFDPKRVDTAKLIAYAVREARREVADAELFRIDMDGVGPDGFANLTYPSLASDHGSVDFRFFSPSRSKRDPSLPLGVKQKDWKCEFRIETEPDGIALRPLDGWECTGNKAVPAPRCTPADLWKRALAKGAPSNAVASLGYRSNGRPVWYFDIGEPGAKAFSQTFADDCR
jgi:serine/threonine-protein kinase